MTKPVNWKVPDVRRALRAAHGQQLVVEGYKIHPDGTIDVTVRDCAAGGVVLTAPPPNDLTGEAA
jgi:hypothetical protein